MIGKLCSLLTRCAILPSIPSTLDPASLYVLFCNPSLSTLLTTFQGPAFHCRLMPLHGPVPIVVLPRSRTAITLHPRSTPYPCASIQPFRSPHKVRLNSNLSTDRLRLPMRHLFPSYLSLPHPVHRLRSSPLNSIPSPSLHLLTTSIDSKLDQVGTMPPQHTHAHPSSAGQPWNVPEPRETLFSNPSFHSPVLLLLLRRRLLLALGRRHLLGSGTPT